ncbi:MAG: hypothetical protein ABFS39_10245 [Pseudomonadota bacterium]
MTDYRIINRYNAYYHGWCLAFGEHTANYAQERDISWLSGEDKMGLILSSTLRKQANRELLGQEGIPELALADGSLRINRYIHALKDDADRSNIQRLKKFLLSGRNLHMYLCSHLFYPSGTRIITFAKKKPLVIMYKEMQPLKLIVE